MSDRETSIPALKTKECPRCGRSDRVWEDRYYVSAWDETDSSGALSGGNFCDRCFGKVMRFMKGLEP